MSVPVVFKGKQSVHLANPSELRELFLEDFMAKKKNIIKIPKSKPKYMPVTKPNITMKSKKDYTRKEKFKKKIL